MLKRKKAILLYCAYIVLLVIAMRLIIPNRNTVATETLPVEAMLQVDSTSNNPSTLKL